MLIALFGALDLIAGILLILSAFFPLGGNMLLLAFSVIFLIKAVFSVASGAAEGFYFDVLGWLDLFSSLLLFLSFISISFDFYLYLGLAMIVKALYSIFIGISA